MMLSKTSMEIVNEFIDLIRKADESLNNFDDLIIEFKEKKELFTLLTFIVDVDDKTVFRLCRLIKFELTKNVAMFINHCKFLRFQEDKF